MTTGISATTQYLTFRLDGELFAIEVAQVREILELSQITRVPDAPAYLRGVVNVRGSSIPVVDLRAKFGLAAATDTVNSRIVVMEVELDGELTVVGGLADAVTDVIEMELANINPPPRIAGRWRSAVVRGMGKHGDRFVIILNLEALFAADQLALADMHADAVRSDLVGAP